MYDLFEEFRTQFPSLAESVKSYTVIEDRMLEVIYEDGSKGIYDDLLKSYRYFPSGKHLEMTENRWRMELGSRIYRVMLEKGITMKELARWSGVCYTTLSKWINGHKTPGSYGLKKVASALGVHVSDLLIFEKYYAFGVDLSR